MALKRVYGFTADCGLGIKRAGGKEAGAHDALLKELNITNWQLAMLYVVGIEGDATDAEIGRALGMDRSTVATVIEPLRAENVIQFRPSQRGRAESISLTNEGQGLLGRGLSVWNAHNLSGAEAQRQCA